MPIASRSVMAVAISGIILFSLGLRTGVAALAPLAGSVDLDVSLSGLPLGALGTIPPIAYAIAASVSPWLARRIGIEWTALAVAVLGALAHLWRGLSPDFLSLFVSTVVVMLAAGVGNVIVPGLVKLYAPRAIGVMTALYATAMALSSAAPTVVGLWLADSVGWRVSLASWSIVSVLGAIPWIFVIPHALRRSLAEANEALPPEPASGRGELWRSPTAVSIMIIFSSSAATAYTWFALLPAMLVDIAEVSVASAAASLGLFAALGMPLSLIIPPLAARKGSASILVAASVALGLAGIAGLLLAPATLTVVWVVLIGLAPLAFHLSLTLFGKRTRDHRGAIRVSGFVNTVGYTFAAIIPLVVGIVHEVSGEWTWSLIILGAVIAAQIPAMWVLSKDTVIEDELAAAR